MEDAIKELFGMLSKYEIFVNMLPGSMFCVILNRFTVFSIPYDSIIEFLILSYLFGLLIGRIGSLIVEKIFSSIGSWSVKRALYGDYLKVETNAKIKTLNEKNTLYRTMIAMFLVLFIIFFSEAFFQSYIYEYMNVIKLVVVLLVLCLFISSYYKQTNYIRKNVQHLLERDV